MAKVNKKIKVSGHSCIDCAHCVFCETWGHYKCIKFASKTIAEMNECDAFKLSDDGEEEKICHCKNCVERRSEE